MSIEEGQFDDDPKGLAEKWEAELEHSNKMLEKFHLRGKKCTERFRDNRDTQDDVHKLNLFTSNVITLRSMLFGRTPKIEVKRRYADPDDDVARVGSEVFSRILNNDVEESDDNFNAVLRHCLDDRLIPGLGIGRVRYEFQTDTRELDPLVEGEEPEEEEVLVSEEAPIDYVQWKDFRWGYCRTWSEVPWIAFRSYLNREEAEKRFGKKIASKLTYKTRNKTDEKKEENDIMQKARIWEIWDKSTRQVLWWSYGVGVILDVKDDPLELSNFFPCPRPLAANLTTDIFVPMADYWIAQDLYVEIDRLETRIAKLTEAVKVVGAYDSGNKGLKRMLKEGVENDLIPVETWASFTEKGGFEGAVDWLPIEATVNALTVLRQQRDEAIRLLYQVTGLSDIMRGAATEANRVSATEQSLKAKFGSVRVQALQDEFALFASELSALKAEVIAKHFSIETIVKHSNMTYSPDADKLPAAVDLIKQPYESSWRIHIASESVAMVDYAELQSQRTEYINALAIFMQSSAPLVEVDKNVTPYLLELLKWGLAGFKGSNQIEGIIDKAIEQMQKPQQPQEKSPEEKIAEMGVQLEQMKAQLAMQKEAQDHQHDVIEEKLRHEHKVKEMVIDHELDVKQDTIETGLEIEQAKHQTAMQRYLETVKAKNSGGNSDA